MSTSAGPQGSTALAEERPAQQDDVPALERRLATASLFELATDLGDAEFRAAFPREVAASAERLGVDFGAPAAVAFARLQAVAPSVRSWAENSVLGYGGTWVSDAPPAIKIGTVRDPVDKENEGRVHTMTSLGFAVELEPVAHTADQLVQWARTLTDAAADVVPEPARVRFIVNYAANGIDFHGEAADLESILRRVPSGLRDVVTARRAPLQPAATVPGGWDGRIGAGCTMAFDVVTPSGSHGVLTAGHCGSTGPTYGSVTLGSQTHEWSWWVQGDQARPYDRQIHAVPSPNVGNGRLVIPGDVAIYGLIIPVQGTTVCRYGATTHEDEGVRVRCTVVDGFDADGLVRLRTSCIPGDSGGPSWQYNRAVGIAAATTSSESPADPNGFCFMANAKDALNGTDYFYKQSQIGSGSDHRTIGLFRSVAPTRVLNGVTRSGEFLVSFGSALPYEDVEAVVYSIKARGTSGSGYLQAYPAGTLAQGSILNFTSSGVSSNTGVTQVRRVDRAVTFRTTASAKIWVDVIGYIADTSGDEPLAGHRRIRPLDQPTRALDTTSGSPVGPGSYVQFRVRGGATGVPTSATHVIANVAVLEPTSYGHATVYASGNPPGVTHLNWAAGQNRANLTVTPIASNDTIRIYNSHGRSHFVVHILGYGDAQNATTSLGRTLPAVGGAARLYDSRNHSPLSASSRSRCHGLYGFRTAAGAGLPIDGLRGVWLNVIAVSPTAAGRLTVYRAGTAATHPNLRFMADDYAVFNLAFVSVPAGGRVCVRYGGSGSVHYVLDAVAFTREDT